MGLLFRKVLFWYSILYSLNFFGQLTIKDQIDSIKTIKNVEKRISAFESLIDKEQTLDGQLKGDIYHQLGKSHYKIKTFKKAIFYYYKAIKYRENYKKINLKALNSSRNNLAYVFKKVGLLTKQDSILVALIHNQGTDIYTFNAYWELSKIERKKGDFYKALQYLKIGLSKEEIVKFPKYENKIRLEMLAVFAEKYKSTINIAEINIEDLKIIEEQQRIIEEQFSTSKLKEKRLYIAYSNLANLYDTFGKLDKASALYEKAKVYYLKKGDTINYLKTLNNNAILYAKQHRYNKASLYFKEVITTATSKEQIASAYDNLGYFLPQITAQDKIAYFKKALYTILGHDDKKDTNRLPTLDEIKASEYEHDALIYLIDLANQYVMVYEENLDRKLLYEAKAIVHLIDELVSIIRYQSDSEKSKLFWITKGVNTYMLAVKICYLLELPEEAFYFMEKNKSLLLQEKIKTVQAKLDLEIPSSILKREHELSYQLLRKEKDLHQNLNDKKNKELYLKEFEQYQSFIDSIKINYPAYVKIKQEVNISSLKEAVNTTITTQENCFIEYILHEKDGYGLFVNHKETILFKIANVKTLQEELVKLKAMMRSPLLETKEIKEFKNLGRTVFKRLFPFDNSLEKLKNKKVIIVADHTLSNFPFEALPINLERKLTESYLVNFAEISYIHSFSTFRQIQKRKRASTHKILTIAPQYFQEEELQPLVETNKTVTLISKFKASTTLYKEKATKENFVNKSKAFEVLHFYTHAGIDSITTTPWIAFYDTRMTLEELYGIENNAELVILDACKTSVGKMALGEGIMNLSRGFFYNGAKSVLASQWNVNETSGNEILKVFYLYIEKGKSKSKALQLAKIDYLKKYPYTRGLPYYWAAFTLTGSPKAIALTVKTYELSHFIVISLIVITLIAILLIKRIFVSRKR
ncbi:CHAT domain-containing protein [Aquimarina rhabdastrellae]